MLTDQAAQSQARTNSTIVGIDREVSMLRGRLRKRNLWVTPVFANPPNFDRQVGLLESIPGGLEWDLSRALPMEFRGLMNLQKNIRFPMSLSGFYRFLKQGRWALVSCNIQYSQNQME
ncbi:hypothetical protein LAD64_24315 [Klebsiella pneumoniae]|nr:hypothetical protein [Klebsiella pneumoniae]